MVLPTDQDGVQDAVLEDGKMAATYTAQQRAEILRLAQEVGPLEAAKRKGVPPGTVTAWRCLENKKRKTRQAPRASRATKTRGIGVPQTTYRQKSRSPVYAIRKSSRFGVGATAWGVRNT